MSRQQLRKLIGRARKQAATPAERVLVEAWVKASARPKMRALAARELREVATRYRARKLEQLRAAMARKGWRTVGRLIDELAL